MKLVEFDNEHKRWDRYKAFHTESWGLVVFDTGEVMMTKLQTRRMMYDEYDIQLVATTDKDCPALYFDKECTEPVKKAWITHHGLQELAIDWEQKVAVALQDRGYWGRNSYLGSHVRSASAYWSGAERLPVPLGKITVQPPDLDYKKKVRPVLLAEVIPAITAMYKMSDKPRWGEGGKYLAKEKWLGLSAQKIVADICSESNKRLLLGDLTRIATGGFEYPRTTKLVDFLYVTKGE